MDLRLTPAERGALEEFLAEAHRLLGRDLVAAQLFGSRARGEGHEDSDLDVALVVTPAGRAKRHVLHDAAYDIGLRHGVSLAPLVITGELLGHLRARERRIALEIERDGIAL